MDLTIAHRILGVNSFSSQEQIKNAYIKLVKKWHPDKHINDKVKYAYAEQNIKKIIEAYKYLLNHNSWGQRRDPKTYKQEEKNFSLKSSFFLAFNYLFILVQYIFILIGLPFLIFWYHPLHYDLFPYLHNDLIENNNSVDEDNIILFFENKNLISYLENDSMNIEMQISLDSFLEILKKNNKSISSQFFDFDENGTKELIINIFSDISEYYHSILLFNYKDKNNFCFVKKFDNGTIIDYKNNIFIQPLLVFDSFYFCDSCYFSSNIINNKNIKYISPKIKYVFKDNQLYYKDKDKKLNKKIINNLNSLSEMDYKILNKEFDEGIRRLYAENILSYYYNSFDLNESRNLFYKSYNFSDRHIIWKHIVVELIQEYSILKSGNEII